MPLLDTSPLTDAGGGRAEWDTVPILKRCNEAPNRAEKSRERHRTITGKSKTETTTASFGLNGEGEGIKEKQEDSLGQILRARYCDQFTLELWVYEGEAEKREIVKKR